MFKPFFLIVFILSSLRLFGVSIAAVEKGTIHEAYITQEWRTEVYESILTQPPEPIQESLPPKPEQKYGEKIEWIPGYWHWSHEQRDFIWVTGLWRKFPIGREWIQGKWEKSQEGGWVRLPGFWSDVKEEKLRYLSDAPPDALDQALPPAPSSAFFWILGHYEYNFIHDRFEWLEGRWESFEKTRVYTPSSYLWRGEKGYIYLSAFWDWPLEERGELFASVYIDPEVRGSIAYEPKKKVESIQILERLFPNWPNYLYFFQTHFHFDPDFWKLDDHVAIPWWNWNEWWAFTWHDQWWLWWWWTHPGYPQPFWMDLTLANQIPPPSLWMITFMQEVKAPFNVTQEGVVGNDAILEAMKGITGSRIPILPSNTKTLDEIKRRLVKDIESGRRPIMTPEGEIAPDNLRKPNFGPSHEELLRAPKRVAIIPILQFPKEPTPPPYKKPERQVQFHRSNNLVDPEKTNLKEYWEKVNSKEYDPYPFY